MTLTPRRTRINKRRYTRLAVDSVSGDPLGVVSLALARTACGLGMGDESADDYIKLLIRGAVGRVESITNRAIVAQKRSFVNSEYGQLPSRFSLPEPVTGLTLVWRGADGTDETVDADDFRIVNGREVVFENYTSQHRQSYDGVWTMVADCGWGGAADADSDIPAGFAFYESPVLVDLSPITGETLPTDTDGYEIPLLADHVFTSRIVPGSPFFTSWEGAIHVEFSRAADLTFDLITGHTVNGRSFDHVRMHRISVGASARVTVPLNVFDSISTVRVGDTSGSYTVTADDVASDVQISYKIRIRAFNKGTDTPRTGTLNYLDTTGAETTSFQLGTRPRNGGGGGLGGVVPPEIQSAVLDIVSAEFRREPLDDKTVMNRVAQFVNQLPGEDLAGGWVY